MPEAQGSAENAGSPTATTGAAAAAQGSGSEVATSPFAGLETGSREWVEKSGAKDVATLVKNAIHAESLIGKSVQIPDDKAKPEDFDKFYGKLGRPEKPDGYEFKLPDGIPEGMPYNGELATAFKAEAHKAGLTAKQAAAAHDFFVAKQADVYKAQHQMVADLMDTATADLVKEWGPADGEKFKGGLEYATRALKGLGVEEAFHQTGLLSEVDGKKNLILDAKIALALEKVGRAMFREDALVNGQGGAATDNPFTGTDQTAQMRAVSADREGAKRLIKAAGKKLSDWGLTD